MDHADSGLEGGADSLYYPVRRPDEQPLTQTPFTQNSGHAHPTYDAWPNSRGEVYEIKGPCNRADLEALAIENQWVRGIIEDTLYEAELDSIDALDEDQLSDLVCRVADWVSDFPDERDAEYVTLSGRDGQGAALWYFRDQFEYCDEFNIVIVEGECPGSSYLGAELRMPVKAANDLAVALGVPIQFQWLGF